MFALFERYLPVLIEPVIGLGLGIEGIAEVAGAGAGHPVHGAVGQGKVVDQLLVATLVVLLHNAEVSHRCGYGSSNMQGLAISNLSSSPL